MEPRSDRRGSILLEILMDWDCVGSATLAVVSLGRQQSSRWVWTTHNATASRECSGITTWLPIASAIESSSSWRGIAGDNEIEIRASCDSSEFAGQLTRGFDHNAGNVSPPSFKRLLALRQEFVALIYSRNA
jgi:hypothetical protein